MITALPYPLNWIGDRTKENEKKNKNKRISCITGLLDSLPYVDFPELKLNKNETTQMPFRYVKGDNGEPFMPKVCYVSGVRKGVSSSPS